MVSVFHYFHIEKVSIGPCVSICNTHAQMERFPLEIEKRESSGWDSALVPGAPCYRRSLTSGALELSPSKEASVLALG